MRIAVCGFLVTLCFQLFMLETKINYQTYLFYFTHPCDKTHRITLPHLVRHHLRPANYYYYFFKVINFTYYFLSS